MPGTHDTLAFKCSDGAICSQHDITDTQDRNLEEQLADGVRYWDIRLRKVQPGLFGVPTHFEWYHGNVDLNIQFGKVLIEATEFLAAYPEETILVKINTEEQGAIGVNPLSDFDLWNSYLDGSHGSMNELDSRPFLFIRTHSRTQSNLIAGGVNAPDSDIPTLGAVRGKMVWFMNNWRFADPTLLQYSDIQQLSDLGTYSDGGEVFQQLLSSLEEVDHLTLNQSTRFGMTGGAFGTTPFAVAGLSMVWQVNIFRPISTCGLRDTLLSIFMSTNLE